MAASGERSIPLGPVVANTLGLLRDQRRPGELVFATAAGTVDFRQTL